MARVFSPAINENSGPLFALDGGRQDSGARVALSGSRICSLRVSRYRARRESPCGVARESTEGNYDMDLVAIQIGVTAVLLIAHFSRLVWDRVSSPHER